MTSPTTSLGDIRDAIKDTLKAAIPDLHVYENVPDSLNLPAVVVVPAPGETADFEVAMGRGVDTWNFELTVLVSRNEPGLRQPELDRLVYGKGAGSIREAIWNRKTLGIKGVDAHVANVTGYGGSYEIARTAHTGAKLALVVHVPLGV
jgi:hypothetical protein